MLYKISSLINIYLFQISYLKKYTVIGSIALRKTVLASIRYKSISRSQFLCVSLSLTVTSIQPVTQRLLQLESQIFRFSGANVVLV